MQILMIAERLPPHIGGVEQHVAGLTRQLITRGYDVILTAPKHDPSLPDEEEKSGARVIWLPCTGHKRRDYLQAWYWWASHRSLLTKVDILHFHDVYALLHWSGPARIICPDKPFYLTFHGCEMRHPIPYRSRFYHWLGTQLVHSTICVGHYLVKWFNLQPKVITYGAVTLPQEIPPPPSVPHAVFLGRIAADTGLDIYLRGLGLLKRRYNLPLSLTICGNGPLRSALERLAAEENIDVTFVGFVQDPTEYLTQSSVALTSGFLAILEAAALRRPIFSVYHNPVKESYLRDIPNVDKMVHIAGTPEELADQLASHLLSPVHTAAMIDKAAAFAAQHTWEKLADDYLELWRDHR